MRATVIYIVLLSIFLIVTIGASNRLEQSIELSPEQVREAEVLYLPNGTALDFISFGYRNFLADVLWFQTVNYFGKHFRTDRNYEWLAKMCDLVTDLDPGAAHAYEFAALMLAWLSGVVLGILGLLSAAISLERLGF